MEKYESQQSARNDQDTDAENFEDEMFNEHVKANPDFKQSYDRMKVISRGVAKLMPQSFKHCNRLCFYATLVVSSNKRVVYAERPPGHGKTWENILIGIYFAKHLSLRPVYCTITTGLVK